MVYLCQTLRLQRFSCGSCDGSTVYSAVRWLQCGVLGSCAGLPVLLARPPQPRHHRSRSRSCAADVRLGWCHNGCNLAAVFSITVKWNQWEHEAGVTIVDDWRIARQSCYPRYWRTDVCGAVQRSHVVVRGGKSAQCGGAAHTGRTAHQLLWHPAQVSRNIILQSRVGFTCIHWLKW